MQPLHHSELAVTTKLHAPDGLTGREGAPGRSGLTTKDREVPLPIRGGRARHGQQEEGSEPPTPRPPQSPDSRAHYQPRRRVSSARYRASDSRTTSSASSAPANCSTVTSLFSRAL